MNNNSGVWLSIIEYSTYKHISISSIRRRIKNGQVKYKHEDGKYLIYVTKENWDLKNLNHQKEILAIKLENEYLKTKIKMLEEENNDLKMLVQLYEKNDVKHGPPRIPMEL